MRVLAVTNMYPTPQNRSYGTFIEQQIKGLNEIGIEMEVMHVDRSEKGMGVYKTLAQEVQAKVQEFRPDLVHVMYGGIMADIVTKALQNTKTPVAVSFCGSDLLGEHLNGIVRKITNHIFGVMASHRAAKRAHGIIVKSRNLQNALPRPEDRKRARIIANGVSLDRFQPLDRRECRAKLGWDQSRFFVLFPTNAGDRRKRLWLAEGAVRVAKEAGLDIELIQLKGVPHAEVGIWINASDVVILTSQHEGSPNVVKEALACNVPIVTVDVGDVVERLEGIAGCYIAEENERDLGDKLRKVHDGLRVVEGRDKVLELTLERVAERVKAFYEEVLHNYQTQTRK